MAESDQEKRRAKLQQLRERRGGRRKAAAQPASPDGEGNRAGGLLRKIAERRGKGGNGLLAGNRQGLGGGGGAGQGRSADGQQDRPLLRKLLAQRRGQGQDGGLGGLRDRLGSRDPGKLREKIEQRIERLRGLINELDGKEERAEGPAGEAAALAVDGPPAPQHRKVTKKT